MCDCGYFLIILTYFCCFWSSFTPGKQIGEPGATFQCRKSRYWYKASPHGIDDAIAKFVLEINGFVYFPDNIDIE